MVKKVKAKVSPAQIPQWVQRGWFSPRYKTYRGWAIAWGKSGKKKSKYYHRIREGHLRNLERIRKARQRRVPKEEVPRVKNVYELAGHAREIQPKSVRWKRAYYSGSKGYYYKYFMAFRMLFDEEPNTPPDTFFVDRHSFRDKMTGQRKTFRNKYVSQVSYWILGSYTKTDFKNNLNKILEENLEEVFLKFSPWKVIIVDIFRHKDAFGTKGEAEAFIKKEQASEALRYW